MADAGALKAPGVYTPCGFESRPRHSPADSRTADEIYLTLPITVFTLTPTHGSSTPSPFGPREIRRDQERNRQTDIRARQPDPAQDERNRPVDVRRHRRHLDR